MVTLAPGARTGGRQLDDSKYKHGSQTAWVQMLSCLISFKILGKSLHLSGPQFPGLINGDGKNTTYLIGLLRGLEVLLFA